MGYRSNGTRANGNRANWNRENVIALIKVGDLSLPSFQMVNGASENLVLRSVGHTVINIKCSNFNNVIFSGLIVFLINLSQQVIFFNTFIFKNH